MLLINIKTSCAKRYVVISLFFWQTIDGMWPCSEFHVIERFGLKLIIYGILPGISMLGCFSIVLFLREILLLYCFLRHSCILSYGHHHVIVHKYYVAVLQPISKMLTVCYCVNRIGFEQMRSRRGRWGEHLISPSLEIMSCSSSCIPFLVFGRAFLWF